MKMTNNAFNSGLEIAMRLLLLMYTSDDSLSIDDLAVMDFVSVYASDFGLTTYNIHGNNRNKESEFAARRQQVKDAIRFLVTQDFAGVEESAEGFLFYCTPTGEIICDSFQSEYAADYTAAALKAIPHVRETGLDTLLEGINRKALHFQKEE